ncbi:hypothetical protein LEP1GSC050_3148 [Leptospira broomii serovar Hurstbridge str. 5399]|uniref:Uncharacterized protein n=1 Tax=Leptospira broomii serovar Hurstbridge str. 5399 TaxID=1049789 RepID=T0FBX3_9LEPT|nr:hypothetical protein [Leptospira broomii]EQA45381.1 hypothetical protein LEP1GSC050_3148 [Leptospira broomii serovar Hurstbridge str. 5399]
MKGFLSKCASIIRDLFQKFSSKEGSPVSWKRKIFSDPFVGIPSAIGVCLLILGTYLTIKGRHSIDSSINDPAFLISKDADLILEIFRPETFIEEIARTSLGKQLSEDGTFQKILTLPELRKVSSVLYLLEAKTGVLTEPSRLAALFDGPLAVALFPKSNWLLVGKASLKSKLGVSLLTAFKGETIVSSEKPAKEEVKTNEIQGEESSYGYAGGGQVTHSADDFVDQFAAGSETFGNIEAFRYEFGKEKVYAVILGDFIILTNSDDVLDESLSLAGSAKNSSIVNARGFLALREESGKADNKILLYLGPNSLFAPLTRPFFEDCGAGLLLGWKEGQNLAGTLYRIGGNQSVSKDRKITNLRLGKILPKDANFVIYSDELKSSDLWSSLLSLDGEWEDFSQAWGLFAKKADIQASAFFGESPGVAISFNGFENHEGMIYPRFGIGLPGTIKDDRLLRAFFKVGTLSKSNFQEIPLESYSIKNGGFYNPTTAKLGNWTFFASDRRSAEEVISSSKGNRPNQTDLLSVTETEELKEYPHHLTINVPAILTDLRTFYVYGSKDASEYSIKTVDKDIQPFLDKFSVFDRVILSFGHGPEEGSWGKMKVLNR